MEVNISVPWMIWVVTYKIVIPYISEWLVVISVGGLLKTLLRIGMIFSYLHEEDDLTTKKDSTRWALSPA